VVDEAEVVETIRSIARSELELERTVQPGDDLLADLGLDSLGLTVLAVGLENRFRVKLSQEDAVGVRTVADLAALVVRRSEVSA
jgi:acyl carrier protein